MRSHAPGVTPLCLSNPKRSSASIARGSGSSGVGLDAVDRRDSFSSHQNQFVNELLILCRAWEEGTERTTPFEASLSQLLVPEEAKETRFERHAERNSAHLVTVRSIVRKRLRRINGTARSAWSWIREYGLNVHTLSRLAVGGWGTTLKSSFLLPRTRAPRTTSRFGGTKIERERCGDGLC